MSVGVLVEVKTNLSFSNFLTEAAAEAAAAAPAEAAAAAPAEAPAAASVSEENFFGTLNLHFLVFVTLFLHGG